MATIMATIANNEALEDHGTLEDPASAAFGRAPENSARIGNFTGERACKRPRLEVFADPHVLICLNLNGLKGRCLPKECDRSNKTELALASEHTRALVAHLFAASPTPPDLIFLSELQLRAHVKDQRAIESAGVGTKADQRQAESAHDAWAAFRSAPQLQGWSHYLSLHSTARGKSGVCVLLRPGLVPLSVRYSMDPDASAHQHHPEGRVIFLEFESFRALLTYSPNNGAKQDSYDRRKEWDNQVLRFEWP